MVGIEEDLEIARRRRGRTQWEPARSICLLLCASDTGLDAADSRETTDTDRNPSPAIVVLSRFLNEDGMTATVADDGNSVGVSKADNSYCVSLDGVEGNGPYRSQLEEAVERVRAATETTTN